MTKICEVNKDKFSEKMSRNMREAAAESYDMLARRRVGSTSMLRVVQHGDANPNNLFLAADASECCLVDFQEVALCNPLLDLAWLFVTSVTPELRREKQLVWLRDYYSQLGVLDSVDFEFQSIKLLQVLQLQAMYILIVVGPVPIDESTWLGKMLWACASTFEDYSPGSYYYA